MKFIESLIISTLAFLILAFVGYTINQIKIIIATILKTLVGKKGTEFIINKITFIGTVHHELAHALLSFLSGAKVVKIRLIEFKGNRLGSVEYIPRGNIVTKSIQHTLAAYAPLICGIITEVILISTFNFESLIWINILKAYIMFSILLHMTMSKQDIKMCLKGLPICIIIVAIILFICNIGYSDIILIKNLIEI